MARIPSFNSNISMEEQLQGGVKKKINKSKIFLNIFVCVFDRWKKNVCVFCPYTLKKKKPREDSRSFSEVKNKKYGGGVKEN